MPAPKDERPLPGQKSFSYRIGTFHSFLREMKDRIGLWETPGKDRTLSALATREADDPSIALMDAWAVVADSITFYQERIANEGFLRTAEERQSVLELARQIGYELKPGVAASAVLQWILDETAASPPSALICAGTQVQSIPDGGALPQAFETGDPFTAHRAWNAMLPRISTPQIISADAVLVEGIGLSIKPGDVFILDPAANTDIRQVRLAAESRESNTTLISFQNGDDIDYVDAQPEWPEHPQAAPVQPGDVVLPLTKDAVRDAIFRASIAETDFTTFCEYHKWNTATVVDMCRALRADSQISGDIIRLGGRFSFYGVQRPVYESLPPDIRTSAYPEPWDTNSTIWTDPRSNENWASHHCYLEREAPDVAAGQHIVIRKSNGEFLPDFIEDAGVTSLNSFAVSAKATGLTLREITGTDRPDNCTIDGSQAFIGEHALTLAPAPLDIAISAGTESIVLDDMVTGLRNGQQLALTGKRADADSLEHSELVVIDAIEHAGGYTRLTFKNALQCDYYRDTVSLAGNVTPVTHGETVAGEVLGSSSGKPYQRFVLHKSPLTWVAASEGGGAESTLTLRVNGIEWKGVDSLYQATASDEVFTVRLTDDGETVICFGNGVRGAIPPAGLNNITADYRTGIGIEGIIKAQAATLITTRPYGVQTVSNPLPSGDAEDPESRDDARMNAPRTVRTLDRIVSLRDYEDFCRTYAGIGKAQAAQLSVGGDAFIHISVSSSAGDAVSDSRVASLIAAIENARDSTTPFIVENGRILQVTLTAGLIVNQRYEFEQVAGQCRTMLLEAFSFSCRTFGQAIDADDVIRVLHDHEAVIAVDIDSLALVGDAGSKGIRAHVAAPRARAISTYAFESAVLLVMPAIGITLTELMSVERA